MRDFMQVAALLTVIVVLAAVVLVSIIAGTVLAIDAAQAIDHQIDWIADDDPIPQSLAP